MEVSKEKVQEVIEKYIVLIPVIFALAVIPLIVRVTYYDPGLSEYTWFAKTIEVFDMFMYHKNQAMLFLDGVLVVAYIYLWIRKKLPMSLNFLPLLVYVILVALSSIFSIAPIQTWYGFYGMLESAYALFGYCMICYYAFAVIRSDQQLKIVLTGFAVGVLILTLIGLSQYLGHDFYMTEFGKSLIIPGEYKEMAGTLTQTMGEHRVYASLYNPNYVGVYGCTLMPLLFVLAFSSKKNWHMVLYLVLIALLVICLVGAGSKTSIFILVTCMIFLALYFGKRHWRKMVPVFIIGIGIFALLNISNDGESSLVDSTIDSVSKETVPGGNYALNDIVLEDEAYYVTYNDKTISVRYLEKEDGKLELIVCDETGTQIPLICKKDETGTSYLLEEDSLKGLSFVFGVNESEMPGYYVTEGNCQFFVYYSENYQTYLYTNHWGRATKLYASESFDFPLFYAMGGFSGRGYIWSKSVPLLKETILIGSGPDTFAFMFPQYDYVSIAQNGYDGRVITKPHNMYLQIGVQTGVLSLFAFLAFNICYLWQSVKLYYKRPLRTFVERCGAGIFVAVVGFLFAGLIHDSTIGTSIVYWTLIGIGLACNAMLKPSAEA